MDLKLSEEESSELNILLIQALGDVSQEIAATDNASYRMRLRERRDILRSIQQQLDRVPA